MNYTVITDIFGNKISKGDENNHYLPFILLHSVQPHLVIEKIEQGTDSIWQLVFPTIMHTLYFNRLNPSRFAPLGHIWLPKNKLPNKVSILLVNTDNNISKYPIDFVKVGNLKDIFIWKPICSQGYRPLGYLASAKKPSLNSIRTVNKELVTTFRDTTKTVEKRTKMNEFNLLSYERHDKFTVKRTNLLRDNNIIKLFSNSKRKILTENKDGTLGLDKDSDNYFQKVNYTVQGELKLDGKCLGTSIDENIRDNFVYLQKCDDSDGQKWYPYRDSFISQFDQSCLNSSDPVTTTKCDEEDRDQSWKKIPQETVIEDNYQETDDNWVTKRGKRVVLIEPDNPWYINKVKRPVGIIKQKPIKLNEKTYQNADYYSKFMMDTTRPDMGYGYSLAQRLGRSCSCLEDCNKVPDNQKLFEHFDEEVLPEEESLFNFNLIACSLLLIVIILVGVRIYVNSIKNRI